MAETSSNEIEGFLPDTHTVELSPSYFWRQPANPRHNKRFESTFMEMTYQFKTRAAARAFRNDCLLVLGWPALPQQLERG